MIQKSVYQTSFSNTIQTIWSAITHYKSAKNPCCIDLVLVNSPMSIQNTLTITTALSDFHKMAITVLKTAFAKLIPKKII